MLRLFIIFSSCFDKNLLEKWLEINDFGLDIIGRDDIYSLEDFYMAGIQIAEHIAHFCGRFQVVMAIHFNVGKQLHIHFIANNIDMDNGHRMDLSKKRLSELKFGISAILVQYHISAIRQRECWNDNILTTTSIGTIMMDCTGLRSKEL